MRWAIYWTGSNFQFPFLFSISSISVLTLSLSLSVPNEIITRGVMARKSCFSCCCCLACLILLACSWLCVCGSTFSLSLCVCVSVLIEGNFSRGVSIFGLLYFWAHPLQCSLQLILPSASLSLGVSFTRWNCLFLFIVACCLERLISCKLLLLLQIILWFLFQFSSYILCLFCCN